MSLAHDGIRGSLPEPANIPKAKAEARIFLAVLFHSALNHAEPFGVQRIDGLHSQAMALRVLDDRGRAVEAHWLIVQQGGCEGRQVMPLEIRARVADHRKT